MQFLYHIPSNNIGSTLCIVLIMLVIMFCQSKRSIEFYTLKCTALTLIFAFLLIYWWNYHITQTYRKYTKNNDINTLNLLLEEKNKEIELLRQDNDTLSRAIHKDNNMIPIIYHAIIESYENQTPLDFSKWDFDSVMYQNLKQLYSERGGLLKEQEQRRNPLPQTAFQLVNAAISFMYVDAKEAGIPFQVVLFDDLTSTIPEKIAVEDFSHLLSDLLSNALNACRDAVSPSIQIYLGKTEGISSIRICNNGSIFHRDVLQNLGLARYTTHPETGGSGIGLMDIWKTKEKYKATLLIEEITEASSSEIYTCINILFNRKNHYIIQSDRYRELSTYINRPDIMIIAKE